MSTEIYYFSGTGNSLHVARELQKRIPGANLIPVVSLLNRDVIETRGETVGLVFPVYLSSVPAPVRNFLKKLDLKQSQYIFAVATRAGAMSIAHVRLEKILKKKGKSLDSYFIVNMANNSPTGLMPPNFPGAKERAKDWINQITKEKVAMLEKEVQDQLDTIQKVIINQERNPAKSKFSDRLIAMLLARAEAANEHGNTEIKFYSDPNCTGCGVCEQVCLSGKIQMANGQPVWQKGIQCFFCYACFNACPEQCLLVKDSYTEKSGRYIHPEVSIKDIAGQK